VALYAGRLSAEKGLDVVLDALPQVHTSLGLRLVVIGEGHLRPRLERLARERPGMLRVLPFEGDRGRLARAYASADLFFAPCPYETFGLAALEAMASGVPVVGVAAGGIGRLLFGADWGRTYQVGDPADCARAVLELAALDLRALGARARAAAVASYGWDRTFTELVGLYRRLLSDAPSAARVMSTARLTP
jgi:glycosyltransferase involved in cell wall biosynthesis